MTQKRSIVISLLAALLFLSGCTAAASLAGTALYGKYAKEGATLQEKSYAAADYLVQQSSTYYDRFTPITIMPFTDFERSDLSSKLGRMIPNQIGSRFAQLGYQVDLSRVALNDSDKKLMAQINAKQRQMQPKIIISGTYKRERPDMPITVRIMEAETGYTISAFEYFIKYSGEGRKLSEPEIRIMRAN